MNKIKELAFAIMLMGKDYRFETETFAVGGGEWSIEVFYYIGEDKFFVCEFVGSNGTQNDEPADLWGDLSDAIEAAKGWLSIKFGGGFVAK